MDDPKDDEQAFGVLITVCLTLLFWMFALPASILLWKIAMLPWGSVGAMFKGSGG